MARVRFEDGTTLNFQGTPSPQDIDEAYANVKGGAAPKSLLARAAEFGESTLPHHFLERTADIPQGAVRGFVRESLFNPPGIESILPPAPTSPAGQMAETAGGVVGFIKGAPLKVGVKAANLAARGVRKAAPLIPKFLRGRAVPTTEAVRGIAQKGFLGAVPQAARTAVEVGVPAFLRTPESGFTDVQARTGQATVGAALGVGTGAALAGVKGIGRFFHAPGRLSREASLRTGRVSESFQQKGALASRQSDARVAALEQERQVLEESLSRRGTRGVLVVRQRFGKAASEASDTYEAMLDTGLKKAGDVQVDFRELSEALQQAFPDDPAGLLEVRKRLGITPEMAELLSRPVVGNRPNVSAQLMRQLGGSLSARKVLENIRSLRSRIPFQARAGRQLYTPADMRANRAAEALAGILESKGVTTIREANAFWSKWAPIRNQAFKLFHPFQRTATETKAGSKFLTEVAKGGETGDRVFVRALEQRLGVPLTRDLRAQALQLNDVERRLLQEQVGQKEFQDLLKTAETAKQQSLSKTLFQKRQGFAKRQAVGLVGRAAAYAALGGLLNQIRRAVGASGGGGDGGEGG